MSLKRLILLVLAAGTALTAAPFRVLWWDSTPDWGGQAPDSFRQEMSDYVSAYGGGSLFASTYVGSETPGTLAAQLAAHTYDVIVFDATSSSSKFNAADVSAVQDFYKTNSNLLFDGSLYIRNITFNSLTEFPGPNNDLGDLTVNEVFQLGSRGGGIMVGTDHNCCQVDANQIVQAVLPGASFSGITVPSTDGQWNGTDLLNAPGPVASLNIFNHWSAVPSQAISPTGNFTDSLGKSVTLYSQVDVADQPGGGPKYSYISTSWKASGGGVVITDPDPPDATVPEPSTYALIGSALAGLLWQRRRRAL